MAEISPEQEKIIAEARQWIIRRIRSIRESRGYTQLQVAEKMGISYSRVSDLEKGVNDYKVSTMLRAAYALGVSAESLIRGCPDFVGRGRSRKVEPMVIVSAEKLQESLVSAGLSPKKAEGVVQGFLVNS